MKRTPSREISVTELILGDICVFTFSDSEDLRVIRDVSTGEVDGEEFIRVEYLDGSNGTYGNWVKLLVASRN